MSKPEDFDYVGRVDGEPINQADHYYRCKACGQPVDKRDLVQVLHHEALGHRPIEGLEPPPEAVGRLQ